MSADPSARAARRAAWVGVGLAAAAAVGFGLKSVAVKMLYGHGIDVVTQVMWRMAFALPLFVAMAWWAGRGQPALTRSEVAHAALLGFLGYYLASFLDMASINYISVSLERLIFYLNPTLVVLLAWLLQGKVPSWRQAIGIAASYAGVMLMIDADTSSAGDQLTWGVGLVCAAALSYAAYVLLSGELSRKLGAMRLAGWASTFASLLCIAQFAILRPVQAAFNVDLPVLCLSLFNATVGTVLPITMVMVAIARVGPSLAAQGGLIGAVFTVMTEPLFLGTRITGAAWCGVALVIVGILASVRAGQRPLPAALPVGDAGATTIGADDPAARSDLTDHPPEQAPGRAGPVLAP